MDYFLVLPGIIFFYLLIFLRIHIRFSAALMWPEGFVIAVSVAPVFGAVRINMSFGLVKRDNWTMYYRFGRGKVKEFAPKKKPPTTKKRDKNALLAGLSYKTILNALKSIELKRADVYMQIGAGDADKCALACGAIEIALKSCLPLMCDDWSVRIEPKFNASIIHLDLTGMLVIKTENIMTSAYQLLSKAFKARKTKKTAGYEDKENEEDNKNAVSASN